jgi:rhodanese-related sulfurtransferase
MKNLIRAILFGLIPIACAPEKTKKITDFEQDDLRNAILIDVRTPEEYANGHLENAVNINWYDSNFGASFDTIDRDKTIYVYCKKGGRSAKAAQHLDSLGYVHVVDLLGGYDLVKKE